MAFTEFSAFLLIKVALRVIVEWKVHQQERFLMSRLSVFCLLLLFGLLVGCDEIQQEIESAMAEDESNEAPEVVEPLPPPPEVSQEDAEALSTLVTNGYSKLEPQPFLTARGEDVSGRIGYRKWRFEEIRPVQETPTIDEDGNTIATVEFKAVGQQTNLYNTVQEAANAPFEKALRFQINYYVLLKVEEERWIVTERKWAFSTRTRRQYPIQPASAHSDFVDWVFAEAIASSPLSEPPPVSKSAFE